MSINRYFFDRFEVYVDCVDRYVMQVPPGQSARNIDTRDTKPITPYPCRMKNRGQFTYMNRKGRPLAPDGRSMATLFRWATVVAGALLTMGAQADPVDGKPNIVLIMSDYMGYHDIEPYGADDVRTPALGRLASEGVKMSNFYAASPVCGPARAALFSGQYPARLGFEKNIRSEKDGLTSSVPTLSSWLKEAGYQTALLGKWHLGSAPDFTPNAHGYDQFFGHHQWTVSYYRHLTEKGEPGLYLNDQLVDREGYLTDLLSEGAVEFIEDNRDRPFFLTLSYNAALPPYQPPGLPESRWDEGWDVNKATREDYVQMVERMDEGVGEVLNALDENDLADNTLVVYLYDHGGRHLVNSAPLFHGFATLWEGGIRIPLIMRLPGRLPVNKTVVNPGITMDLTATILDLAGLEEKAASLDGSSLLPVIDGRPDNSQVPLYWRADLYDFGKQRAIRDKRFKYVEHGNTQFLFDIDADSSERNNLFALYPDVVNRLRGLLNAWEDELPKL
jgi:arylsulfatase A-like enzyme